MCLCVVVQPLAALLLHRLSSLGSIPLPAEHTDSLAAVGTAISALSPSLLADWRALPVRARWIASRVAISVAARSVESFDRNVRPALDLLCIALLWQPVELKARLATQQAPALTQVVCMNYATELTATMFAEWNQYVALVRATNFAHEEEPDRHRRALAASRRAVNFWLQKRPGGGLMFPTLAPVALLVLAIVNGIAPAERSFTQLRTTQTLRRLHMTHETREQEAYIRFNRRLLRRTLWLPADEFWPALE